MSSPSIELPANPRILVIRPDHLGDMLFVGPALALLRSSFPDAQITLLCGPWAKGIAERLPGADQVETFDFPYYDRKPPGRPFSGLLRLRRGAPTFRGRFDAALVLRDDDHLGAALARLARIPVRLGHEHPKTSRFLSHELSAFEKPAHCAAANLALVQALLVGVGEAAVQAEAPLYAPEDHPLCYTLTREDKARADALMPDALVPDARPIIVHPGSGAAIKRWRAGGWAQVLEALAADGSPIILTGGPGEEPLTREIAELLDLPALDLAGRTDLGTLAALYQRARLVMGPDSGPLHLAVAMGAPTVHLYGPADPARFGPWGSEKRHKVVMSDLPCAACGRLNWADVEAHPCIRVLENGRVVVAAREALEKGLDPLAY